jgi:hypothetical protein
MEKSVAKEIQSLRSQGLTYQEIVDALNEKNFKNAFTDTPFSIYSIRSLMRRNGTPLRSKTIRSDNTWLTAEEKMAELGVGKAKFRRMRDSGELIFKRPLNPNSMRYLYRAENYTAEDTAAILADAKV